MKFGSSQEQKRNPCSLVGAGDGAEFFREWAHPRFHLQPVLWIHLPFVFPKHQCKLLPAQGRGGICAPMVGQGPYEHKEPATGIQGRDQSGGEVGNAARGEARGWDAGGGLEEMLRKILSSPYCTGGETHLYNVPKGMWPVKESVS